MVAKPCLAEPARGLSPKALDSLVEAVLEAHGGRQALGKVRTLKVVGRLKAVLRKDRGTGTVYFQQPDKLLSDNRYRRSREVRILNGSKGWVRTSEAFHPAPAGVMLGMRYSLVSYQLPLELAQRREELAYMGRVEQLGRRFEVLELQYSKDLRVRVYVESESKRIAQVAGYIKIGDKTVVLSRVLGDYREVDGVLYPFHQKYHSGPTLIAEKWVEAVEINPPSLEVTFTPE
jgi:hypothetical protein